MSLRDTIIALTLLASLTMKITYGIPPNLSVLACPDSKLFFAPKGVQPCSKGEHFVILPIDKAFKLGYRPSKQLLAERQFDAGEELIWIWLLDRYGIWKSHPWNPDGTWRD